MNPSSSITTLFLDIGGVLLTNGWDRNSRRKAADKFSLDYAEFNERHHLTFDTYEEGKHTLDQYLDRVVFYTNRDFSLDDFKAFMYQQSQPFQQTIDYFLALKKRYNLRFAAVSNEGRELTDHRIQQFKLKELFTVFVSSCFVHLRKPDGDIYRLALDLTGTDPGEVVYIDDRAMFVDEAEKIGIRSICHKDLETTSKTLESFDFYLKD
jgi:putative hydrolase of the HAD superfamily